MIDYRDEKNYLTSKLKKKTREVHVQYLFGAFIRDLPALLRSSVSLPTHEREVVLWSCPQLKNWKTCFVLPRLPYHQQVHHVSMKLGKGT